MKRVVSFFPRFVAQAFYNALTAGTRIPSVANSKHYFIKAGVKTAVATRSLVYCQSMVFSLSARGQWIGRVVVHYEGRKEREIVKAISDEPGIREALQDGSLQVKLVSVHCGLSNTVADDPEHVNAGELMSVLGADFVGLLAGETSKSSYDKIRANYATLNTKILEALIPADPIRKFLTTFSVVKQSTCLTIAGATEDELHCLLFASEDGEQLATILKDHLDSTDGGSGV